MSIAQRKEQTRLLRILSDILSPPVLAAFAFGVICYNVCFDFGQAVRVFAVCLLFQTLLPIAYLFALYRKKKTSDLHISRREERTVVFLLTIASYLCGALTLKLLGAPQTVIDFMIVSALLILMVCLINHFIKISLHLVGAGGYLTGVFLVCGPHTYFLELLVPLLSWVRLRSGAHTKGEVLAGILVGHIFVFLAFKGFLG